jgi:long-chain acyl-CoA synthetase
MLVHHFLENSAKRLPEKVALICDDQRLTYREINSLADQFAAALVNMGVRRQDRIVIFLDNSAESVISLFGILKAGAIFIMVNPTMKSKKLNYILNDSGARVLITHTNKTRIVKEAINDVPDLEHIIWKGKSPKLPRGIAGPKNSAWKELFPLTSDLYEVYRPGSCHNHLHFRIHRRTKRRNVGPL